MGFVDDISDYRSLAIVGLEKNTGKTECLNYISDYHENALAKAENAGVGAALEPTDDADNTTL